MTANNQSLLHQLTSDTSSTSVPSKPSTSLCSTRLSDQVSNNVPQNHMYSKNSDCISVNDNSSFATPIEAIYIHDIKIEPDLDEYEASLEDPFKNHDADKQPAIQIQEPSNTASSSVPGTERLQHPQVTRHITSHTSNNSLAGKSSFCVRSNTQFPMSTNSSSSLTGLNLLQHLVKKYHIKDLTIRLSRLSDQVLDSLQQNGTVNCSVVDNQMSEQRNVRIKLEPVTVDPSVLNDQVSDNLQQNFSSTVDDDDIQVPFEAIYDPVVKCEPDLVKTEPNSDLSALELKKLHLADSTRVFSKQEVMDNAEADSDVQPDLPELQTLPGTSNPGSNKDVNISGSVFNCAQCNLTTYCKSEITSHIATQHVKMFRYQCQECGMCFKNKHSLYKHFSHVHPNNFFYKCPLCKRGFQMEKFYNAHIKNHDKILQCDMCSKILSSKQRLTEHKMRIHTKSSCFPCSMCSKISYTDKSFKQHIKQVHSISSFKCDICDKSFKLKCTLNAHRRQVHASVRAFACSQCKKAFVTKFALKQHSEVHSDLRPFKCKKCSLCFNRKGVLTEHISIVHINVRAFKCHLCGKSFNRKSNLTQHLIRHSDVRNYKCEQCGKLFKTKPELKLHLSSHSEIRPFACAQCHKNFKSKPHLVRHLRHAHSDLRPFSCDKCPLACKSESRLKRHQLVHSINLRKFECRHCKNKFKYRYNLTVHIKTKHSNLILPAIL